MANEKKEQEQFARCLNLTSYKGNDGKTYHSAVMRLDDDERKDFEVPVTEWFQPVKGSCYVPFVDIIDVAKISARTQKAYIKRQVVVKWEEAF